ncbi:MAG: molecular chaperone DnaJ [Candidatus Nanopelagicales bacterium]
MANDYYATLGVARDATPDEIKRAYRRLARELHPDVNPDPETQERFKEVTAAYEVLSDAEKRQMYDLGADPRSPGGAGPFGPGAQAFGFGDIMDAFFGGGQARGPKPRVRRGQDALIKVGIDLAEAAFGAVKEIQVDTAVVCPTCTGRGTAAGYQPTECSMCRGRGEIQSVQRSFLGQVMTSRPCPQCQGFGTVIAHPCPECNTEGRVRTRRTLKVKIPAGIDDGTRIQLSGEGEVGPGGGPAGDLYVEVTTRPHPVFERRGDDLHCSVALPMTGAALGTVLKLETLDGVEDVVIVPGTQPGHVVTLRARGVPHLRASGRGDLIIHVDVRTPTRLDARQEELLRQLAALRDEERVETSFERPEAPGLFSRIKDAFTGR